MSKIDWSMFNGSNLDELCDEAGVDRDDITEAVIPDGVTSIGNEAFEYCSSLKNINIPNSVTSIGNLAFCGCRGLRSIIIPNSVTSIGKRAFSGCTCPILFERDKSVAAGDVLQGFSGTYKFLSESENQEAEEASNTEVIKEEVNHPSRYNQNGGIECIDAMVQVFGQEATNNFAVLNAFKYIWRHKDKNGKQDIDKAIWYLNYYKEHYDDTVK